MVLICDPQHVLVSFGDVVVASVPVNLCDSQTHTVNVTVFGNSSLLEVDGQLAQVEMMENVDDLDLTSSYSTFIGGIPGNVSHQPDIGLILVSLQSHITYTSFTAISLQTRDRLIYRFTDIFPDIQAFYHNRLLVL